jgi:hypothetical protein
MSNNVGAKTPETKPTDRATNLLAQPADTARYFRRASLQVIPAAPSGAPISASAPPVKGVLSITTNSRKRFFQLSPKNTQLSKKTHSINTLTKQIPAKNRARAETKVNNHTTSPLIHRLTTKDSPKTRRATPNSRAKTNVSIMSVSRLYRRGAEKTDKETIVCNR